MQQPLAAFISGSNDNDVTEVSTSDVLRVSKVEVSPQTKLQIIRILQEFATPDASESVVRPALQAFHRAKLPATSATLHALTKHRSTDVARDAADILTSMGEKIVLPPPQNPVRFQILINGEPLPPKVSVD